MLGVSGSPSLLDASVLDRLPRSSETGLLERIASAANGDWQKVIVIDDGVTASQNVPGSSVINSWSPADIEWLLQQPGDVGYVLTGCRYRGFDDAAAIGSLVGRALRDGAQRKSMDLTVVSCSEAVGLASLPIDVSSLVDGFGLDVHGVVMLTCDPTRETIGFDGARYRRRGEMYAAEPHEPTTREFTLRPAGVGMAEWEPAIDLTANAAFSRAHVSVETLRTLGTDHVAAFLAAQPRGTLCVVDAVETNDLVLAATAVRKASQLGVNWLVRSTGAAVPVLAGIEPPVARPPMSLLEDRGGLVIVGTDAPLSQEARAALFALPSITLIEASVDRLTGIQTARDELLDLTREASAVVRAGRTAIVYVAADVGLDPNVDDRARHQVAVRLSRTLLGISDQPSYVVVQGSYTTNVLMVDTINARRTAVAEPVVDGIAVWELGGASAYRDMPLVAMPNGVSSAARDQTLVEVVTCFEAQRR